MNRMLQALGNCVECMVCLEVMTAEIRQCLRGHSVCGRCSTLVPSCPLCKSPITAIRNYKLEDVIANLKEMNAEYDHPNKTVRINSERRGIPNQGYNRPIICDFTTDEAISPAVQLESWGTLQFSENSLDFLKIQMLPNNPEGEVFWYINKISAEKREVYWMLQYNEPKVKPNSYYYEFTLSQSGIKSLKFWEICHPTLQNMHELINAGSCITIGFNTLKNYIREDNNVYFYIKVVHVPEGHYPCAMNHCCSTSQEVRNDGYPQTNEQNIRSVSTQEFSYGLNMVTLGTRRVYNGTKNLPRRVTLYEPYYRQEGQRPQFQAYERQGQQVMDSRINQGTSGRNNIPPNPTPLTNQGTSISDVDYDPPDPRSADYSPASGRDTPILMISGDMIERLVKMVKADKSDEDDD